MTLRELSNEICALGFNNYAKLDLPLKLAAKRALTSIYGEMEIMGAETFYITARLPSSKVARLHHTGGGVETLPLSGKAYAMTVSGCGSVTIYDGANSSTVKFSSKRKLIRGFLKYGGRVVFSGSSSFEVFNLVTFDEIFGDDIASIPDGTPYTKIQMRDAVPNFLGFAAPPTDGNGNVIQTATLHDGVITLPSTYSGEINIKYRRLPDFSSLSEPDEEIDIPNEYAILLPLLTAFYVLLDEDEEKAEIYKNSYLEMLECIKKNAYSLSNGGYADVNGWGK